MAALTNQPPAEKHTRYQITVLGLVNGTWSEWFNGMEIISSKQADGTYITFLRGAVADQAALRGILNRLWDLNATLVAVQLVPPPKDEEISEDFRDF